MTLVEGPGEISPGFSRTGRSGVNGRNWALSPARHALPNGRSRARSWPGTWSIRAVPAIAENRLRDVTSPRRRSDHEQAASGHLT